MKTPSKSKLLLTVILLILTVTILTSQVSKKPAEKNGSSYMPSIEEPFEKVLARDKAQKDEIMKRQMDLLNDRYDLSEHVTTEVTMSKGKPLPVGPTAKLKGVTWDQLAATVKQKSQALE